MVEVGQNVDIRFKLSLQRVTFIINHKLFVNHHPAREIPSASSSKCDKMSVKSLGMIPKRAENPLWRPLTGKQKEEEEERKNIYIYILYLSVK